MIVDIAFAVVPTILGFGAAGLIGSAAIRTAKDVMNSISMLQTLQWYGSERGIETVRSMNTARKWAGEKLKQYKWFSFLGHVLTLPEWYKSRKRKDNQDN
jgi:hypothetical protein